MNWPLILVGMLAVIVVAALFERAVLLREVARRRGEERDARTLASTDPLTGLSNRRVLASADARHGSAGGKRALLVCDLDGFKQINDTHGHAGGDAVLRQFAKRIAALSYPGTAIEAVRLGGDEFVLLAAGSKLNAHAIARDVLRCATAPYDVSGKSVLCSVTIGIASASGTEGIDELLRLADDALYDAKRNGLPIRVAQVSDDGAFEGGGRRLFEAQLDMSATSRTLFAAAVGINRLREMRHALGYRLVSKLVRELTQRFCLADDGLRFERLSSEVLGVTFESDNADSARAMIERLRDAVEGPLHLADGSVEVRLTIGLAGPGETSGVRDLVEQAQAALEDAWRSGARFKLFEERDFVAACENIGLMSDLRTAIAEDRLEMVYQPKLRLATGEIEGVEALVRWDHPTLGPIPPLRFVPIAEKTGDIRKLTDWVIDRTLDDREKLVAGGQAPVIYVNISAELVDDDAFASSLLARLAPLNGGIGIEITETAVIANAERALPYLEKLAAAGVKIAIDDYGVGLSSLSYLKQLPATELKLDRMFITNLGTSHRDPMIVRSTIELAHGLGLLVTAEGVDNADALALLKVMRCDLVQGFSIAKPMPASELASYLSSWSSEKAMKSAGLNFPSLSFSKAA